MFVHTWVFFFAGQLWVSVGGGKVMVFDASSWSLTNTCHVGNARLVKELLASHSPFHLHMKIKRFNTYTKNANSLKIEMSAMSNQRC